MSKAEPNARRSLLTIVDEIRATFRNDNSNIIRRGELLIEARKMAEHGEWLPWLESHFDMSEDTAERLMSVARLADKFRILRNMDLSHLPKGVLYALASGDYSDAVIKAVLIEAESVPIAISRLYEIEEALNPEPVESEDAKPDEASAEEEANIEAEKEAEDILDGPPPELPPVADPPESTDPKLTQFDKAIKNLLEVHTSSVGKFITTEHCVQDLMRVSEFVSAVATMIAHLDAGEDKTKEAKFRKRPALVTAA